MRTLPRYDQGAVLNLAVLFDIALTHCHIVEALVAGTAADLDGGCFARIPILGEGDLHLDPGVRAGIVDEARTRPWDRDRLG
jgi:hypothetical protein